MRWGWLLLRSGPHSVLRRINPDYCSCRFLRRKYHSHMFLPIVRLYGPSTENDPRGHQTERSLASRTRFGCSWRIVGMGTQPSGRISQTSGPSSRRLPAVSSPRPRKRSRISGSFVQPPPEALRHQAIVFIVLSIAPLLFFMLIAFTFGQRSVRARGCACCLLYYLWFCAFLQRLWIMYNTPDTPDCASKNKRIVRNNMYINPVQL